MIRGLLGSTSIQGLRQGMDQSIVRSRDIAHRVANASNGNSASFESALDGALGPDEVDLETEMVALANEQLTYEAMGSLLQKVYGQVRASLRSS